MASAAELAAGTTKPVGKQASVREGVEWAWEGSGHQKPGRFEMTVELENRQVEDEMGEMPSHARTSPTYVNAGEREQVHKQQAADCVQEVGENERHSCTVDAEAAEPAGGGGESV